MRGMRILLAAVLAIGFGLMAPRDARAQGGIVWPAPVGTWVNHTWVDYGSPAEACRAWALYHTGSELLSMVPVAGDVAYTCYYYGFIRAAGISATTTYPACRSGGSATYGGCLAEVNPPRPDCTTCVGNPVELEYGGKVETAVDWSSGGARPLELKRRYDSRGLNATSSLGMGWALDFDVAMLRYGANDIEIRRPDGTYLKFTSAGPTQPDVAARLVFEAAGGYTFIDEADGRYGFTSGAQLSHYVARDGYRQDFAYDGYGRLIKVTDSYGRVIDITRFQPTNDWGRAMATLHATQAVVSLPDASGVARPRVKVAYGYATIDNQVGTERLASVTVSQPDGSAAETTRYLYENAGSPYQLTGIVDPDGQRRGTWVYDGQSRVVHGEHAGGAEAYDVVYDDAARSRAFTNALGHTTVYQFAVRQGRNKLSGTTAAATATTPAMTTAVEYDAAGYVSRRVDANGNAVTYTNDASGNELSRTEAAGTAQARTITTTWHAGFRLPTRVAEAGRATDYAYDSLGRLSQRTVTDSAAGRSRSWSYTWGAAGRLLSVDGPRTDVADVTGYAYDALGNLTTVTDALGRVTRLSGHDVHGLPGQVVYANGLTTTLA